jgi:hypothetical protein
MSRSAADATRFTATGPYVSSKVPYQLPNSVKSAQSQQQQSPKPSSSSSSGETPRQKVERLRAQARAAKLSQSTTAFDRIIERGRRVANGAHKVMIYSLITASGLSSPSPPHSNTKRKRLMKIGVCGALTLYSVVSLTMWNRRQRELWLDKQLQDLQAAREAYVHGTATAEQLEILKNEKIGEIEKRKKQEADEQKLWNRTKRYLFDGLKKEEDAAAGTTIMAAVADINSNNDNNKASPILEAVNAKKAEATQQPGQLDVLAANAEFTAKKSWSSWIWGK